jgi:hypothetical protein
MQVKQLLRIAAVAAMATACRPAASDDASTNSIETAASNVARFLTGHTRFSDIDLADSVDLYIAPEGGGGHARLAREHLSDPKAWKVASAPAPERSFVPNGLRTRVITEVGKYMNCQPSPIGTRFPQLAKLPHVGVRLEPPRVKSCLQTWNATFFFDTTAGRPRLVAAVYDQFEW